MCPLITPSQTLSSAPTAMPTPFLLSAPTPLVPPSCTLIEPRHERVSVMEGGRVSEGETMDERKSFMVQNPTELVRSPHLSDLTAVTPKPECDKA